MFFLAAALALILGGGVLALCISLLGAGKELCWRIGQAALGLGGCCALAAAGQVIFLRQNSTWELNLLPQLGQVILRLDALSAFFILPLGLFSLVTALSSRPYMEKLDGRRLGLYWFFACLLAGGMLLVLSAGSSFFFLLAWELMSLAPFFMLFMHKNDEATRTAAWIYLIMAHIGALVLMFLFVILTVQASSFSFSIFESMTGLLSGATPIGVHTFSRTGLLFCLALIGFGIKCGFVPVHVWLPHTYGAAPAHMMPLLSGAMINMGFYGFLRVLSFLGMGQPWWAYALIITGIVTAFLGILMAMAQPEIKRTLAYSSTENMGIVCLALGFGMLAAQNGRQALAVLAYCGAMLHLLNHSLFKGLLFLCAGNVQRQAGTTRLNFLGGLQKKMPLTGLCFGLGCMSLVALPPMNGFAGEFLLYLTFIFGGDLAGMSIEAWVYWGGLFALALVGGMALLCFTKTYGLAFLGNPRTPFVQNSEEAPGILTGLCLALAALCFFCALAAPWLCSLFGPLLESLPGLSGINDAEFKRALILPVNSLYKVTIAFIVLCGALLAAALLRRRLLKNRIVRTGLTWDCGYSAPSAHMQYTSGSFAQFMLKIMKTLFSPRWISNKLEGYFPKRVTVELNTRDFSVPIWNRLLFESIGKLAALSKRLQHGLLNVYVLYILLALIGTLTWKLR